MPLPQDKKKDHEKQKEVTTVILKKRGSKLNILQVEVRLSSLINPLLLE